MTLEILQSQGWIYYIKVEVETKPIWMDASSFFLFVVFGVEHYMQSLPSLSLPFFFVFFA